MLTAPSMHEVNRREFLGLGESDSDELPEQPEQPEQPGTGSQQQDRERESSQSGEWAWSTRERLRQGGFLHRFRFAYPGPSIHQFIDRVWS